MTNLQFQNDPEMDTLLSNMLIAITTLIESTCIANKLLYWFVESKCTTHGDKYDTHDKKIKYIIKDDKQYDISIIYVTK